jgi:polysaccharide export outer membrane protein
VGLLILINMLERTAARRRFRPKFAGTRSSSLSLAPLLTLLLAGCTSLGPTTHEVEKAPLTSAGSDLRVVPITDQIANQVNVAEVNGDFASRIGDAVPVGTQVGVGDTLEVTIWEAAPAALFGAATINEGSDSGVDSAVATSRPNTLPGILVGPSGAINIPFAGQVPAAGRTLREIEHEIVRRLQGRAHLPQVMVRITGNVTHDVTVLGDVKLPQRVPLTPKGERLLDVIAQAGGTNEPLDRVTIEINRGGVMQRMAARDVMRDPRQNIILRSNDVISVIYQPYSFTVMGAAGKNDEIRFEGVGLTLAQALGRIGGLRDMRADPRGVFLFRWEKPQLLGAVARGEQPNSKGLVPVIYQADLKRPETYFAVQHFEMRDGDVIYVSNSKASELQRFLSLLSSSILPISTARTIAP